MSIESLLDTPESSGGLPQAEYRTSALSVSVWFMRFGEANREAPASGGASPYRAGRDVSAYGRVGVNGISVSRLDTRLEYFLQDRPGEWWLCGILFHNA
jgi:hypothetical protein